MPPSSDLRAREAGRASVRSRAAGVLPWSQRIAELFWVGGATPLLFPLAWWLRHTWGLDASEFAVGALFFYGAHLLNDPHFAVTYVLFYRDARARAFGSGFGRVQRIRYVLAGVVAPLLLLAWAAFALLSRSVALLALLFQLMFLLVGWHYVKQGFGVLTVLAQRRGVRFWPRERACLLAHCYAGWAYAWASPVDLGTRTEQKGLVYTTLAHPPGLERATQLLFFASALPVAWVLLQKRRREGGLPLFTPLLAFLSSTWVWTVYSSIDPLVRYAIPALHSLQYLYLVWLLQSNEAREREREPWFEATVGARMARLAIAALGLGWLLFHGAPSALDELLVPHGHAAMPLGPTPYLAVIFAFVNLHHYFMDAVLWRHDNPLTRYLRVTPASQPASEGDA